MTTYKKTAVSFLNPRETALYFDYVIPLGIGMDILWLSTLKGGEPDFAEMLPPRLGVELLPPELRGDLRFARQLVEACSAFWDSLLDLVQLQQELPPGMTLPSKELLNDRIGKAVHEGARLKLSGIMNDFNLLSFATDVPDIFLRDDPDGQEVSIALGGIQLVDVRRTPWEHILEFRRSPEAVEKLRRLRLFVYENYQGKDSEYVKDDILQRVLDYEQTIAEWGFETRRGAAAALLSSPFVRSSLAGSFVTSLLGQPLAAILAAAGGIALEVGSITLQLKRRSFELQQIVSGEPGCVHQ